MLVFDALESGFRNYFTISGRASRLEYWVWNLFYFAMLSLIYHFQTVAGLTPLTDSDEWLDNGPWVAYGFCVLIIPSLTMTIRRLHDLDKSGWNLLYNLIPVVGALMVFWWLFLSKGTVGSNRFGDDPWLVERLGQ